MTDTERETRAFEVVTVRQLTGFGARIELLGESLPAGSHETHHLVVVPATWPGDWPPRMGAVVLVQCPKVLRLL